MLLTLGGQIFNEAHQAGWGMVGSAVFAIVASTGLILLQGWFKQSDPK